jgi:hypothetical protein
VCDVVLDLCAERCSTFGPAVRGVLRSGRPWSEELLLAELARTFPGLCDPSTDPETFGEVPWEVVAHAVIAAERALAPSARGRSGLSREPTPPSASVPR